MLDNPLVNLSEPSSVFALFIREDDPSPLVVNLLAAETLVARHKGRTGQLATGTVDRAGVVVVCHDVFPCCVLFGSTPELGERFTRLSYAYCIRYAAGCQPHLSG
jgi:hypothetical protein